MTEDSTSEDTVDGAQTEAEPLATATPSNYKVIGEFTSSDGAGVLGLNNEGSDVAYGVRGETPSSNGSSAGVYGESTATSGGASGVTGVTQSNGGLFAGAAGVSGEAPSTNSSSAWGVTGTSNAEGYYNSSFDFPVWGGGVYGSVSPDSGEYTAGVYGTNSGSHGGATGVYGITTASSGVTYGVYGTTQSSDRDAAAVYSDGRLHVEHASPSSNTTKDLNAHAAAIRDTESQNSRVLALKAPDSQPSAADNFVTFLNENESVLGTIEGDSSGGVSYASASADFAEYLPRRDADESIETADVVGIHGGTVTKRTEDADHALVVSGQPVVTGNVPGDDPEDRADHETVAMVGQVPAKVRGSAAVGDVIVPSGEDDGTGRAVDPDEWTPADGAVVGRAWEATDTEDVEEITVAVGLESGGALESSLGSQDDRIAELERANDDLRDALAAKSERVEELASRVEALEAERDRLEAENEALEERLGGIDERVARLEGTANSHAPADD